ncbi:MAG: LysR family transcriptional regulator [Sandaracinaceae bacterium]
MDWDDVRYMLALARLGSVRAAGASLGVSHSTVARRVEALEEKLGARLFNRTRDGYTQTDAGQRMLPIAERVEREMALLERRIVGTDERLAGPVHVTCCDEYVAAFLLEDLSDFCDAHPEIELHMTTDSRPFDLSKREADIAIRALGIGQSPPEHLIGRRLAPIYTANYIAVGDPGERDPALDNGRARWLAFDDRSFQEAFVAESSHPELPLWGAFASIESIVQACRHGLGIVTLPCYIGDPQPSMERLAASDLGHRGEIWLLSHPDLRDNARLRAARSRVAEALIRREALFRGADSCGL